MLRIGSVRNISNLLKAGYKAAIFMGAGMSASAGIPLANKIMQDIELKYKDFINSDEKSYPEYMRCLPIGIRNDLIRSYIQNPRINLAHLYLGALVSNGYVDRILTTNFDHLAIKALALNNIFPSIYDLANENHFISNRIIDPSIFYLHGQNNGFVILNTDEEVNSHLGKVREVFKDTAGGKRFWIVVGYSGQNDPILYNFGQEYNTQYGVFWVCYNDEDPCGHVIDNVFTKTDSVYALKGYDADTFFISLAKELGISKPEIIGEPFRYLMNCINDITPLCKDKKNTNIAQKAIKDVEAAIKYFGMKQRGGILEIVQKTRDIWVYGNYEEINDELINTIKRFELQDALDNIKNALINWEIELAGKPGNSNQSDKIQDLKLKLALSYDKPTENEKRHANLREFLDPETYKYFYNNSLSMSGMKEARSILGTNDIKMLAKRVYQSDMIHSYIHRIYVRQRDFKLIEDDFKENRDGITFIRSILKKKNTGLINKKTHQFVSTIVGEDSEIMYADFHLPAMLHMQISYIESENGIEPVEFLISKYLRPLSACGFLIDEKTHSQNTFSMAAEDLFLKNLQDDVLDDNKRFYYPFFNMNKYLLDISSPRPEKLLRILMVPENTCNYNCVFCCFWNGCDKESEQYELLKPEDYVFIAEAANDSGCKRVMLTGGEPLLAPEETLLDTVDKISELDELEEFWITTNGSMLTKELIHRLKEKGLKKIAISIPGENEEKYKRSTNTQHADFKKILNNIELLLEAGIKVRVDVPLNSEGIRDFKGMSQLLKELEKAGVSEVSYFKLHQSPENQKEFNKLFVDPDEITKGFYHSPEWNIRQRDNGQKVFYNKKINVIIPAEIHYDTEKCKSNNCGLFCQGNYAIYLISEKGRIYLRSCHRKFRDRDNEYEIPRMVLESRNKKALTEIFNRAWAYVYR